MSARTDAANRSLERRIATAEKLKQLAVIGGGAIGVLKVLQDGHQLDDLPLTRASVADLIAEWDATIEPETEDAAG